jgi:hypothetical protein
MCILGRPSLIRTGLLEGFRNAKLFKGLTYINSQQVASIENIPSPVIIQRLEEELAKRPKDWLVLYQLGDWYSREKRYGDAINVLKKAYRIRPRDPRSTFALATTYRMLTRAKYEGMDLKEILSARQLKLVTQESSFDPAASGRELKALN